MNKWKAAIFDMGGVLVTPLSYGFQKYEWELGMPRGFLSNVFKEGDRKLAFNRAMKGEMTLTQLYDECDKECQEYAKKENITLAKEFSSRELLTSTLKEGKLVRKMIKAMDCLRAKDYKVAVLTNIWANDTDSRHHVAKNFTTLRKHSDYIFESCKIGMAKPDPRIFEYVLDKMNVSAKETIFLDDSAANCASADNLGVKSIHVKNPELALQQLQEITGIDINTFNHPGRCDMSLFAHGYVTTPEGLKIHYVESGQGPPVIFCHGWPECWYSWRHQLAYLAELGYRAIALDQRGFGETSCPPNVEDYTSEAIVSDLIAVMDALSMPTATIIGHDWGGMIVWACAQYYPERVHAVAGINTPFIPTDPSISTLERINKRPAAYDYQLYFQDEGVAEAEFEKDIERTFLCLFRGVGPEDRLEMSMKVSTANVRERGGFLVGFPEKPSRSVHLSEEELRYYVAQFKRSGFRGGLNWYRNLDRNWQWRCRTANRKILQPALMVTAAKDMVLTPKLSLAMNDWVPNLTRKELNCGHWTQLECPNELNETLGKWLDAVHKSPTDLKFKL